MEGVEVLGGEVGGIEEVFVDWVVGEESVDAFTGFALFLSLFGFKHSFT